MRIRTALRGLVVALLVTGVLAALPSVPSNAGSAASAGQPTGMSTVVVRLADQADVGAVQAGTRRARLAKVLSALHTRADTGQVGLRTRLAVLAAQHQVARVTPLWIENAVVVTATPWAIRQLAARADVAEVVPDDVTLVPAAAPATANQQVIRAPGMWDLGHDGHGTVVASLDSGVDGSHPDLATRWRGGTDSWFDPYGQHPTTPTDLSGHGTAVTGVMVGGDASGASLGTAPGASWIAARVFDDSGRSTISAIHQAFQWVLDPDHDPATNDAPSVVNGSWSIGTAPSCDLSFQPDVRALRAAGIVPVFAAGNFGSRAATSTSPANYPESLSVGAVNSSGSIYYSSSRGASTCGGRSRVFPDLVAPGVDITTTDRHGFYQTLSGTSVAAPHVAGALALLLSAMPGLSADQQQQALLASGHDLGVAGPDEVYGNGLLDVVAALDFLETTPPPPPPPPDYQLQLSPATGSVVAGQTATFTVQVSPLNGFSSDVSLSLGADAPGGWTFAPSTIGAGSGVSTLRVATTSTTPAGSYPLTVTASGGSVTHTATGSLGVTEPPPVDQLFFSTLGSTLPPGVTGTADDADIYSRSNKEFARLLDASGTGSLGLPSAANVDGYDRVDATHFYLSFSGTTTKVPGLGSVQDEDVVYYDNGTWSVWFDGTAHGLTADNLDLDAFSIDAGALYFSTLGNTSPPGVGGSADDADVYRYNGANSYTRVWDASAKGLGSGANVDGLVRAGPSRLYLSFSTATTGVPGLGAVEDEDVVLQDSGTWSVWFDGTAAGLTASDHDIDAFDLP